MTVLTDAHGNRICPTCYGVVWNGEGDRPAMALCLPSTCSAWSTEARYDHDARTWRPAAESYEAKCQKCGETFNPADENDLEHGMRDDETECGGQGILLGGWLGGWS